MKDFYKLYKECIEELYRIGIYPKPFKQWREIDHSQGVWGYCCDLGNGAFGLELQKDLLNDGTDDAALKDTIIHELIHTLPGCFDHGSQWDEIAARVRAAYPAYLLLPAGGTNRYRIEYTERPVCTWHCPNCGWSTADFSKRRKHRKTDPVAYQCPLCKGRLKRVDYT